MAFYQEELSRLVLKHPYSVALIAIDLLLSCTTIRVTRTAVSVVICWGPSRLPSKPFFLNSEVRSSIYQT